ncbi:hypothetical protein Afil01_50550 [Actinorhabdospora filicis]|uniref:Uncharacterized protein n=1 Tax=Actinorhabdospora filicis TaxID=1785913 RepID=A0A9W6SQG8_9ACTN|nr:hypothetical protein [Actinorhabdospora filicis]GLZ80248.1 hypothetical protein Afil01_50550 [Actinorhabdospora filicis]
MPIDIAGEIARIEDVNPFPGLDGVWFWGVGGGWFTYTIALSGDRTAAFQVTCRDVYPAETVKDVIAFARANEAALLGAAPLVHVEGFTGHGFDSVAAAIPSVADVNDEMPELNAVTYALFPAWRCEFSGAETEPEAYSRLDMMDIADLRREPLPFLKMRFKNPKTGVHTLGDERLLTYPRQLDDEIESLDGVTGGWIETENFTGAVHRLTWSDGFALDDGEQRMSLQDTLSWARRHLTEGTG